MAYQELDAYVTEQILQGIEAQTIKESLLGIGWKEIDVDNALRDVAADAVPTGAVSVHDDMLRMRSAVNELNKRVHLLEARLASSSSDSDSVEKHTAAFPVEAVSAQAQAPVRGASPSRRIVTYAGLAVLFALIGYAGMASIFQDSVTPVSRIWAQVVVGGVLASAGFVTGRMKKRTMANFLTGTGLALVALATVGAWYVHYMGWSVAVALGALLVTLALVMGRFYDQWALSGTEPTRTA